MAQFYTLEEAAQRLAIPASEFKRRTKTEWTSLRPFRDGPTLRYRAADIDELARSLGAASDPGLALGAPGSPLSDSSEERALDDSPIDFGSDVGSGTDDIFTLAPGDAAKGKGKGKPPGDSDVRLDLSPKSDGGRRATGDVALDAPKPPSSAKLTARKSGARLGGPGSGNLAKPPADSDSSSEFELRLDADSDSLDLPLDGSEEVDITAAPKSKKGPQSGINLGRPADSGVSLEKKKAATDSDSDMDFELSLDAPGPQSGKLGPRTGPIARPTGVDSSSEFELTLDDSSGSAESLTAAAMSEREAKGDIFETDFDLPAVDESGSEVVAVEGEADSDFEVTADSDEASVLSDEAEAVELEEEEPTAARALRGVSRDEDDELATVRTVAAAPPVWGALPAAVLLPSMVVLFLGTLMSFEAVRGMWGYHQPSKPAGSLVRGVAELVGGKVAD